jgi:hypothetical protein
VRGLDRRKLVHSCLRKNWGKASGSRSLCHAAAAPCYDPAAISQSSA